MEFHNLFDDPAHARRLAQLTDRLFDAVMLTTDPGQPRIAGSWQPPGGLVDFLRRRHQPRSPGTAASVA